MSFARLHVYGIGMSLENKYYINTIYIWTKIKNKNFCIGGILNNWKKKT